MFCVVLAVRAAWVRTDFDVLHHPLSLGSSPLKPLCPQCHRSHSVVFGSTSFMSLRPFTLHHLFVQHLLRPSDLCSLSHYYWLSLRLPPLPFWLCLKFSYIFGKSPHEVMTVSAANTRYQHYSFCCPCLFRHASANLHPEVETPTAASSFVSGLLHSFSRRIDPLWLQLLYISNSCTLALLNVQII